MYDSSIIVKRAHLRTNAYNTFFTRFLTTDIAVVYSKYKQNSNVWIFMEH